MAEKLTFPAAEAANLEPHLPQPPFITHTQSQPQEAQLSPRPFVTLTFATSLDSSLALAPGARTVLSGPQSKAMTHFLRSRHAAILVGVGTALADDPGLNCRLDSSSGSGSGSGSGTVQQPRPIVVDPRGRWAFTPDSKVLQLARQGLGLAPYIITSAPPPQDRREVLERHGGKYIFLEGEGEGKGEGEGGGGSRYDWDAILGCIGAEGLQSVMIEGGGQIINSLLGAAGCALVDSVIVTIAPTWLGRGGVVVSPDRRTDAQGQPRAAVRLAPGARWHQLGEDVVLCGRIQR